MEHYKPVWI